MAFPLKLLRLLTISLSERVRQRLIRYVFPPGPLLVAFSGGPDSVGLTLLLLEMGYSLRLAYVNHNLRGAESQKEEAWVRAFARELNLPLEVLTLTSESFRGEESLQAKARHIRYSWMESILEKYDIPWGVTAHTYEDFVETLLYQFFRGGDIWMLKGIGYRRGRWLRPLLGVRRSEILTYLRARGGSYWLDSSNYTPKYLRNVIRWRVLAALRGVHPMVAERLWERYALYRLQRRRLEGFYGRLAGRYVGKEPFGGHIREGLRADAFYWILQQEVGLSWRQGREIYGLYCKGRVGAYRQVGEIVFCRVPGGLQWGNVKWWLPDWPDLLVTGPGTYEWGLWRLKFEVEPPEGGVSVQLAASLFPLRVRLWRRGDRIAPLGLQGHTQKLSDVWPAVGFYGFQRRHAFVLEDQEGHICYAVAYRVDWRIAQRSGPFLYFSYAYVGRDEAFCKGS